jgi:glycosyltransferase involved in cell wall biosynthesis
MTDRAAGKKLLFLQTEDWTFWSHRLPLARAAKKAGYDVTIALRVDAHGERLKGEGFRLIHVPWRRRSLNPFYELALFIRIVRLYGEERPDIVHQVTAKPIFYGTAAAKLCGARGIVNTLTGLGFVFSSHSWKARLLKPIVSLGLKLALAPANSRTIFQNPDDLGVFVSGKLVKAEKAELIRGSGVDLGRFQPRPEAEGTPLVVLPSRMIWEKGLKEFVAAAARLKAEGVRARFALVGEPDPENPAAVPPETLARWKAEGAVEWWGQRDDMPEVLSQSHVVCLPSYYGEGLPKALIEGAACGRPLVAADVPGSREIVRDGVTGLLVPPRDAPALAGALRRLIEDKALRVRLGAKARDVAAAEFSQERIVEATLRLYQELGAGQRR